jgi:hypothetical protein
MIEDFPTTADEFYARRDDRTNRCVAERSYQSVGCLVTVTPDALKTLTGQVLLITSCNLLSRWCRCVELLLPQQEPLAHNRLASTGLYESVLGTMKDSDPFGSFVLVEKPSGSCALQLHLGSRPPRLAQDLVAASAHGWHATLSTNAEPAFEIACDGNVLGAIGSACLAGAQIFKAAIGCDRSLLLSDGVFDFFHLRRLGSQEQRDVPHFDNDVGRMLVIGAGSVASAAVCFMKLVGLAAELSIVEGDTVKVENFNRSPIFGKSTYGLNKGRALERVLAGTSLRVIDVFESWWEDFIRQRGRAKSAYDVWLPLANEFGVRWSIQNNFPPLMIQASTGTNWNTNFGRHIPKRGDCLVDRFPEKTSEGALACATGTISDAEKQIDAALPFLSFFAGFLVTADICRLKMAGYPQTPNYALFDFGASMDFVQLWDRGPGDSCLCRSQSADIYRNWNQNTRYADLLA